MIQKKNIWLIVDSNVLNEIVTEDSGNIHNDLMIWIHNITSDMQNRVKGKTVTFFVSQETIKDYVTGLSRKGRKNTSKNLKYAIDKSGDMVRRKSGRNGIGISIKKQNVSYSNRKKRVSDRDDEKFLALVEKILKMGDSRERAIIFASKDRRSMPQIEEALVQQQRRIEFADNMKSLKEIIRC